MSISPTTLDPLLLAAPLLALLFATFFRLEERFARPRRRTVHGRELTRWDADGRPICSDPSVVSIGTFRNRRVVISQDCEMDESEQ